MAGVLQRLWPVMLLVACGAGGEGVASGAATSARPEPLRRLEAGDSLPQIVRPAAYAGTLPCADCSGIETVLVLHPDGSYRLRERYSGEREPNTFVSVGRWRFRSDSIARLTLYTNEQTRHFVVDDALKLEALDAQGNRIGGSAPRSLERVVVPAALDGLVRLRAEFRYAADAATIVECVGGKQFPISGDSTYIRLQRAYRENALGAGAAVVFDLVGRLESRAGGEQGTRPETFVVDSFTPQPARSACEASRVRALMAVGDWQLTQLGGEPLPDLARELQPTLRFVLSEPSMFGNASCNRFTGRVVLRGLDLQPAPLAMTRRLCADSTANRREAQYSRVLSEGGWFRAEDSALVLSRGGVELARFRRR